MAEYDTLQANGQRIWVSEEGGTYQNKLIDMSTGDTFEIFADGRNPTVKNIGFKGTAQNSGFAVNAAGGRSVSGTVTIENVYLGDGTGYQNSSFTHGPGGMFIHATNNIDRVVVNNCTVRGWTNNGFYFSNADYVEWNDCLTTNCGVSHYRAKNAEINNCVGFNTSNERHGQGSGSERYGRIVWAWPPGPIDINNSDIEQGPAALESIWPNANGGASQVNFNSGQFSGGIKSGPGTYNESNSVGSNPDLTAPSAVPLTAEQAASGQSGGGGGSDSNDPACIRDIV